MQVLVKLILNGLNDLWMSVTYIRNTNPRDQINVRLVFVVKVNTFRPLNFQG